MSKQEPEIDEEGLALLAEDLVGDIEKKHVKPGKRVTRKDKLIKSYLNRFIKMVRGDKKK